MNDQRDGKSDSEQRSNAGLTTMGLGSGFQWVAGRGATWGFPTNFQSSAQTGAVCAGTEKVRVEDV